MKYLPGFSHSCNPPYLHYLQYKEVHINVRIFPQFPYVVRYKQRWESSYPYPGSGVQQIMEQATSEVSRGPRENFKGDPFSCQTQSPVSVDSSLFMKSSFLFILGFPPWLLCHPSFLLPTSYVLGVQGWANGVWAIMGPVPDAGHGNWCSASVTGK